MKRNLIAPRNDWQSKVKDIGFTYFNDSADGVYWKEDAYYEFTSVEVENIYDASKELFHLCMDAIDYVIKTKQFHRFDLSEALAVQIIKSWDRDDVTLYGRFDLSIGKDGNYKMLEFNADTPTSLFEASIIQWDWMKGAFAVGSTDQFNSIHEELQAQLEYIAQRRLPENYGTLYFSSVNTPEDLTTTYYIKSLADEMGLHTKFILIDDIGHNGSNFVDLDNQKIEHIFKLYPWEWLANEEYSVYAFRDMKTWIEPVWKMLLSNKAILPILWEMAPNHPNLLPAYFEDEYQEDSTKFFVKKPILSREGANVTLNNENGQTTSEGEYDSEAMIYQETCTLPQFDGKYACIGSWIVGAEPCGMGIREDDSPITKNTSKFVPHIFR